MMCAFVQRDGAMVPVTCVHSTNTGGLKAVPAAKRAEYGFTVSEKVDKPVRFVHRLSQEGLDVLTSVVTK